MKLRLFYAVLVLVRFLCQVKESTCIETVADIISEKSTILGGVWSSLTAVFMLIRFINFNTSVLVTSAKEEQLLVRSVSQYLK